MKLDVKECNNFTIEDLGVQEEYVYDIEVENNHNFFANDILVHNSIYICLEDLVNKVMPDETDTAKTIEFLDKVSKQKLEPFINKCYDELFTYLNNKENLMVMDREIISDVAVWTGKKHYFMNVYDNEGVRYESPEFKVMGIEVVKSSTPMVCREKLETALKMMLREDEETLVNFVAQFKKEFKRLPPEKISFPRGVGQMAKWLADDGTFISRVPIHVRGSLIHNRELKKHNLTNRYDIIKEGEKILFTYMKLPNSLHENVFAFVGEIPKELDLVKFVDYDTQFQKTFLDPLQSIAEIIGWKTEKTNDLSSLFG